MQPNRPSVARDTRLLLAIVVISVALLWVLARIRFPDRAQTPNPVPPVLAQLAPPSAFDDMSATVAQVESRLQPSLVELEVQRHSDGRRRAGVIRNKVLALRFRPGLAVAWLGPDSDFDAVETMPLDALEVARDRASRLVVIRVSGSFAPVLSTWSPRRPFHPRFLIAAAASSHGTSFRPVFVGSLDELVSPIWSGSVWALPSSAGLAAGTLVFTADGAWAGLIVEQDGQPALASADTVIDAAERIARAGQTRPGRLGIDVQPLTPSIAAGTGASAGVVVTWVDPQGPASGQLAVTDVIDQVDGIVDRDSGSLARPRGTPRRGRIGPAASAPGRRGSRRTNHRERGGRAGGRAAPRAHAANNLPPRRRNRAGRSRFGGVGRRTPGRRFADRRRRHRGADGGAGRARVRRRCTEPARGDRVHAS